MDYRLTYKLLGLLFQEKISSKELRNLQSATAIGKLFDQAENDLYHSESIYDQILQLLHQNEVKFQNQDYDWLFEDVNKFLTDYETEEIDSEPTDYHEMAEILSVGYNLNLYLDIYKQQVFKQITEDIYSNGYHIEYREVLEACEDHIIKPLSETKQLFRSSKFFINKLHQNNQIFHEIAYSDENTCVFEFLYTFCPAIRKAFWYFELAFAFKNIQFLYFGIEYLEQYCIFTKNSTNINFQEITGMIHPLYSYMLTDDYMWVAFKLYDEVKSFVFKIEEAIDNDEFNRPETVIIDEADEKLLEIITLLKLLDDQNENAKLELIEKKMLSEFDFYEELNQIKLDLFVTEKQSEQGFENMEEDEIIEEEAAEMDIENAPSIEENFLEFQNKLLAEQKESESTNTDHWWEVFYKYLKNARSNLSFEDFETEASRHLSNYPHFNFDIFKKILTKQLKLLVLKSGIVFVEGENEIKIRQLSLYEMFTTKNDKFKLARKNNDNEKKQHSNEKHHAYFELAEFNKKFHRVDEVKELNEIKEQAEVNIQVMIEEIFEMADNLTIDSVGSVSEELVERAAQSLFSNDSESKIFRTGLISLIFTEERLLEAQKESQNIDFSYLKNLMTTTTFSKIASKFQEANVTTYRRMVSQRIVGSEVEVYRRTIKNKLKLQSDVIENEWLNNHLTEQILAEYKENQSFSNFVEAQHTKEYIASFTNDIKVIMFSILEEYGSFPKSLKEVLHLFLDSTFEDEPKEFLEKAMRFDFEAFSEEVVDVFTMTDKFKTTTEPENNSNQTQSIIANHEGEQVVENILSAKTEIKENPKGEFTPIVTLYQSDLFKVINMLNLQHSLFFNLNPSNYKFLFLFNIKFIYQVQAITTTFFLINHEYYADPENLEDINRFLLYADENINMITQAAQTLDLKNEYGLNVTNPVKNEFEVFELFPVHLDDNVKEPLTGTYFDKALIDTTLQNLVKESEEYKNYSNIGKEEILKHFESIDKFEQLFTTQTLNFYQLFNMLTQHFGSTVYYYPYRYDRLTSAEVSQNILALEQYLVDPSIVSELTLENKHSFTHLKENIHRMLQIAFLTEIEIKCHALRSKIEEDESFLNATTLESETMANIKPENQEEYPDYESTDANTFEENLRYKRFEVLETHRNKELFNQLKDIIDSALNHEIKIYHNELDHKLIEFCSSTEKIERAHANIQASDTNVKLPKSITTEMPSEMLLYGLFIGDNAAEFIENFVDIPDQTYKTFSTNDLPTFYFLKSALCEYTIKKCAQQVMFTSLHILHYIDDYANMETPYSLLVAPKTVVRMSENQPFNEIEEALLEEAEDESEVLNKMAQTQVNNYEIAEYQQNRGNVKSITVQTENNKKTLTTTNIASINIPAYVTSQKLKDEYLIKLQKEFNNILLASDKTTETKEDYNVLYHLLLTTISDHFDEPELVENETYNEARVEIEQLQKIISDLRTEIFELKKEIEQNKKIELAKENIDELINQFKEKIKYDLDEKTPKAEDLSIQELVNLYAEHKEEYYEWCVSLYEIVLYEDTFHETDDFEKIFSEQLVKQYVDELKYFQSYAVILYREFQIVEEDNEYESQLDEICKNITTLESQSVRLVALLNAISEIEKESFKLDEKIKVQNMLPEFKVEYSNFTTICQKLIAQLDSLQQNEPENINKLKKFLNTTSLEHVHIENYHQNQLALVAPIKVLLTFLNCIDENLISALAFIESLELEYELEFEELNNTIKEFKNSSELESDTIKQLELKITDMEETAYINSEKELDEKTDFVKELEKKIQALENDSKQKEIIIETKQNQIDIFEAKQELLLVLHKFYVQLQKYEIAILSEQTSFENIVAFEIEASLIFELEAALKKINEAKKKKENSLDFISEVSFGEKYEFKADSIQLQALVDHAFTITDPEEENDANSSKYFSEFPSLIKKIIDAGVNDENEQSDFLLMEEKYTATFRFAANLVILVSAYILFDSESQIEESLSNIVTLEKTELSVLEETYFNVKVKQQKEISDLQQEIALLETSLNDLEDASALTDKRHHEKYLKLETDITNYLKQETGREKKFLEGFLELETEIPESDRQKLQQLLEHFEHKLIAVEDFEETKMIATEDEIKLNTELLEFINSILKNEEILETEGITDIESRYKSSLDAIKNEMNNDKQELSRIEEQLRQEEIELENSQNTSEEFNEKLIEKENEEQIEIGELVTYFSELSDAYETIENYNEHLEKIFSDLKSEETPTSININFNSISNQEIDLRSPEHSFEGISEEIKALTDRIKEKESKFKEENAILIINDYVNEITKLSNDLQLETERFDEEIETVFSERRDKNAENELIKDLREEITLYETAEETVQIEYDRLNRKISDLKVELEEMEQALETESSLHQEEQRNHQKEIEILNKENNTDQGVLNVQIEQLNELISANNEKFELELAEIESEKEELELEITTEQTQIDEIEGLKLENTEDFTAFKNNTESMFARLSEFIQESTSSIDLEADYETEFTELYNRHINDPGFAALAEKENINPVDAVKDFFLKYVQMYELRNSLETEIDEIKVENEEIIDSTVRSKTEYLNSEIEKLIENYQMAESEYNEKQTELNEANEDLEVYRSKLEDSNLKNEEIFAEAREEIQELEKLIASKEQEEYNAVIVESAMEDASNIDAINNTSELEKLQEIIENQDAKIKLLNEKNEDLYQTQSILTQQQSEKIQSLETEIDKLLQEDNEQLKEEERIEKTVIKELEAEIEILKEEAAENNVPDTEASSETELTEELIDVPISNAENLIQNTEYTNDNVEVSPEELLILDTQAAIVDIIPTMRSAADVAEVQQVFINKTVDKAIKINDFDNEKIPKDQLENFYNMSRNLVEFNIEFEVLGQAELMVYDYFKSHGAVNLCLQSVAHMKDESKEFYQKLIDSIDQSYTLLFEQTKEFELELQPEKFSSLSEFKSSSETQYQATSIMESLIENVENGLTVLPFLEPIRDLANENILDIDYERESIDASFEDEYYELEYTLRKFFVATSTIHSLNMAKESETVNLVIPEVANIQKNQPLALTEQTPAAAVCFRLYKYFQSIDQNAAKTKSKAEIIKNETITANVEQFLEKMSTYILEADSKTPFSSKVVDIESCKQLMKDQSNPFVYPEAGLLVNSGSSRRIGAVAPELDKYVIDGESTLTDPADTFISLTEDEEREIEVIVSSIYNTPNGIEEKSEDYTTTALDDRYDRLLSGALEKFNNEKIFNAEIDTPEAIEVPDYSWLDLRVRISEEYNEDVETVHEKIREADTQWSAYYRNGHYSIFMNLVIYFYIRHIFIEHILENEGYKFYLDALTDGGETKKDQAEFMFTCFIDHFKGSLLNESLTQIEDFNKTLDLKSAIEELEKYHPHNETTVSGSFVTLITDTVSFENDYYVRMILHDAFIQQKLSKFLPARSFEEYILNFRYASYYFGYMKLDAPNNENQPMESSELGVPHNRESYELASDEKKNSLLNNLLNIFAKNHLEFEQTATYDKKTLDELKVLNVDLNPHNKLNPVTYDQITAGILDPEAELTVESIRNFKSNEIENENPDPKENSVPINYNSFHDFDLMNGNVISVENLYEYSKQELLHLNELKCHNYRLCTIYQKDVKATQESEKLDNLIGVHPVTYVQVFVALSSDTNCLNCVTDVTHHHRTKHDNPIVFKRVAFTITLKTWLRIVSEQPKKLKFFLAYMSDLEINRLVIQPKDLFKKLFINSTSDSTVNLSFSNISTPSVLLKDISEHTEMMEERFNAVYNDANYTNIRDILIRNSTVKDIAEHYEDKTEIIIGYNKVLTDLRAIYNKLSIDAGFESLKAYQNLKREQIKDSENIVEANEYRRDVINYNNLFIFVLIELFVKQKDNDTSDVLYSMDLDEACYSNSTYSWFEYLVSEKFIMITEKFYEPLDPSETIKLASLFDLRKAVEYAPMSINNNLNLNSNVAKSNVPTRIEKMLIFNPYVYLFTLKAIVYTSFEILNNVKTLIVDKNIIKEADSVDTILSKEKELNGLLTKYKTYINALLYRVYESIWESLKNIQKNKEENSIDMFKRIFLSEKIEDYIQKFVLILSLIHAKKNNKKNEEKFKHLQFSRAVEVNELRQQLTIIYNEIKLESAHLSLPFESIEGIISAVINKIENEIWDEESNEHADVKLFYDEDASDALIAKYDTSDSTELILHQNQVVFEMAKRMMSNMPELKSVVEESMENTEVKESEQLIDDEEKLEETTAAKFDHHYHKLYRLE